MCGDVWGTNKMLNLHKLSIIPYLSRDFEIRPKLFSTSTSNRLKRSGSRKFTSAVSSSISAALSKVVSTTKINSLVS